MQEIASCFDNRIRNSNSRCTLANFEVNGCTIFCHRVVDGVHSIENMSG